MPYILNTPSQQAEMLKTIGAQSVQELLDQIPRHLQIARPLEMPAPLTELALEQHARTIAANSSGSSRNACFLGGGAYDHFIPSVVDEITGRGEFYTAYTPYQAEASQGSLQAFFEYQTMICQLTGMDVANASLYEAGSSLTEAVLMSMRSTGREGRVVVAGTIHPEYLRTLQTLVANLNVEIVVVPASNGAIPSASWSSVVNEQTACIVLQHPNFFGSLEDAASCAAAAHAQGALMVQVIDPISLGILKRPSEYGADIVVGEGQSLGIPLQFGGPYLGIMACRNEFVRKLPGRIIGQTHDRHGRRCFVLNLQGREQHIRREKATSNICTNQGLMALRAAVHMAHLGPQGLREVGDLCCRKAHYCAAQLAQVAGVSLKFSAPFFREFVVETPLRAADLLPQLSNRGFDVGPGFGTFAQELAGSCDRPEYCFLVAVTECRTKEQIDGLVGAVRSILKPD